MLIIDTVSTCFGHLYAHVQEKDHVLLHIGFTGSVGCGWLRFCGATLWGVCTVKVAAEQQPSQWPTQPPLKWVPGLSRG